MSCHPVGWMADEMAQEINYTLLLAQRHLSLGGGCYACLCDLLVSVSTFLELRDREKKAEEELGREKVSQ